MNPVAVAIRCAPKKSLDPSAVKRWNPNQRGWTPWAGPPEMDVNYQTVILRCTPDRLIKNQVRLVTGHP